MKHAFATIAHEIATEAQKDSERLKPALVLILSGVAMGVVCFIIGGGTAQRIVEFAGSASLIIGIYLMIAPKGVARAVSLFGASVAILGMALSSSILLAGGGLMPALERATAWAVIVATMPLVVYIVKTKIIDAPTTASAQ